MDHKVAINKEAVQRMVLHLDQELYSKVKSTRLLNTLIQIRWPAVDFDVL